MELPLTYSYPFCPPSFRPSSSFSSLQMVIYSPSSHVPVAITAYVQVTVNNVPSAAFACTTAPSLFSSTWITAVEYRSRAPDTSASFPSSCPTVFALVSYCATTASWYGCGSMSSFSNGIPRSFFCQIRVPSSCSMNTSSMPLSSVKYGTRSSLSVITGSGSSFVSSSLCSRSSSS